MNTPLIKTPPFRIAFANQTESDMYQILLTKTNINWLVGGNIILPDFIPFMFLNENKVLTYCNDKDYFDNYGTPEITVQELHQYIESRLPEMKPTDLYLTAELFKILSDTVIPCDTTDQEVDHNGNPKFTQAGNPVYRKLLYNFNALTKLVHDKNEGLRIDGQKIAVQQPPMGNFFSLKRKGTYLPGINDVNTGDCWKKDKRIEVPKWSKFISHFVKYLREHHGFVTPDRIMTGVTIPSNDVITEKLIESIKIYYSEEYIVEILDKPSDLYTVDYFNGSSLGSCMSHFNDNMYSNRINIYIYDKIPELKGLLFKRIDGRPVARCLMWSGKYHDRIYGIGHDEIRIAEKTCAIRDWSFVGDKAYETQAAEGHTDISDYQFYPYMDNVRTLVETDDNKLLLMTPKCFDKNYASQSGVERYNLQNTDDHSGEYEDDSEDYGYCEISGDRYPNDELCYIERYGYDVHERYATWSDYHSESVVTNDSVEIRDAQGRWQIVWNDSEDIVFSEYLDYHIFYEDSVSVEIDDRGNTDYVYQDDATYCENDDIWVLNDDAQELYDGTYAASWNAKVIDLEGDDNDGQYTHVDDYDDYIAEHSLSTADTNENS